jgi:hypothetical protein
MTSSIIPRVTTGSEAPVAVTMMSAAPRHGAPLQLPRQRFRRCQRPARDGDLLDLLRPQVDAGQLRHLAGAEDDDAQSGEIAEDLPRQLDRRVADRHGAFAEAGLAVNALAHGERGVKEPVRDRAGKVQVARGRVRRFHLSENLRLADHQRIEPRGHAEQVPCRVDAAMRIEMPGQHGRVDAVVVAEEARDGVRGGVGFGNGVDLGAVARREHDGLLADAVRGERLEGGLQATPREVDRLTQLDGGRAVADANCEKAHRG